MGFALDVLGLGCLAWDQILYVERPRSSAGKFPILNQQESVGGTCGTALRAAAYWGCRAGWAGTIGTDVFSGQVLDGLTSAGVDVSRARQEADSGVIRTWIVVDSKRQSRTVYYDLADATPCSEQYPDEATLRSAAVLLVDTFGLSGMLRAMNIARAHGIPVVADCEATSGEGLSEFVEQADHLILSQETSAQLTGESDPAKAVARLGNDNRKAVVVTCGEAGCWYRGIEMPGWAIRHWPAPWIDAVDTTGCGDVFHGVYAAALSQGLSLEERLSQATWAAALKAQRPLGQTDLPTREEIRLFEESRRSL